MDKILEVLKDAQPFKFLSTRNFLCYYNLITVTDIDQRKYYRLANKFNLHIC